MMRMSVLAMCLSSLVLPAALRGGDRPSRHNGDKPPTNHGEASKRIDARTIFALPSPVVDADAMGSVSLLQSRGRSAIHIFVRHLDPEATFDVNISKGDQKEALGKITIPAEKPKLVRCFTADLNGAQEVPPVTTEATGTAKFTLDDDDLHYRLKVTGLSGPITAAHLHLGAPGAAGAVVYELNAKKLEGTIDVTATDIANLRAGSLYVDVHTEKNADGEIRGQINPCPAPVPKDPNHIEAPGGNGSLSLDTRKGDKLPLGAAGVADLVGSTVTVVNDKGAAVLVASIVDLKKHNMKEGGRCFTANLNGAQETPPVTTDATGVAKFALSDDDLSYKIKVSGLSGPVVAAHIHIGAVGAPGAVVYPINNSLRGTVDVNLTDMQNLRAGNYYVNVHTEKNPDGEIRGQILPCQTAAKGEGNTGGDPAGQPAALQAPEDLFFDMPGQHDAAFLRGDANSDGALDVADAISLLGILYQGGAPPSCEDAADANDDGRIDVSDAITMLRSLFAGEPLPGSGIVAFDETPDELFCNGG